jgi:hypothetical protein
MEGCALGHGVRVQYAAMAFDQSCLSNCLNAGAGASAGVVKARNGRVCSLWLRRPLAAGEPLLHKYRHGVHRCDWQWASTA